MALQLFTKSELNDLVCDLDSSKESTEVIGSGVKRKTCPFQKHNFISTVIESMIYWNTSRGK